jgi:hypothetical protein
MSAKFNMIIASASQKSNANNKENTYILCSDVKRKCQMLGNNHSNKKGHNAKLCPII